MPAGGGDGDGALGHLLAADVGEVDFVAGQRLEPFVEPGRGGVDLDLAGEKADRLGQAGDGDDFDAFDHGRLARTFGRHQQPLQRGVFGRGDGDRQGAFRRPRVAVERQLADDRIAIELVRFDLTAAGQNAQRDRQIERGGLLGQISGGQVDYNPVLRPHEAGIDQRPLDAMGAFFHGGLGQPDEHGLGQGAVGDVDFNLDRQCFDAQQ